MMELQNKPQTYNRLKQSITKLNIHKTQKKTLRRLAWYHVNCHSVYVSQKTLAQDLSLGLRTIERSMKALYDANLVIKSPRKSLHKTNIYVINMALLEPKHSCHQKSQKPLYHQEFPKKVAGEMAVNIKKINKALRNSKNENHSNLHSASPSGKKDVNFHFSKNIPSENAEDHKTIAEDMIRIMDQETQGTIKPDPNYHCTHRKLFSYFKTHCRNDMNMWRSFCKRIGSSPYFVGKRNGFIPPLLWLLKNHVKEKMDRGEFHKPVRYFDTRFKRSNNDEFINMKHYHLTNLSKEEEKKLREKFKSQLRDLDPLAWKEFQYDGWDSYYVKSVFSDYQLRKRMAELFPPLI